jgi:hypothetical protein
MWRVPDKYTTECFLKNDDSLISKHVFEAISKDEAEARTYLSCAKEANNKENIRVSVKRI